MKRQEISTEWYDQWPLSRDRKEFLFRDWISPRTLEGFRSKDVVECGCSCGQHTEMVASVAKNVTAVDLNAVDVVRARDTGKANVHFPEANKFELGSLTQEHYAGVGWSLSGTKHIRPELNAHPRTGDEGLRA